MATYQEVEQAMRDAENLNLMSDEAGKLFASMLVYDVIGIEKRLVDGLNRFDEMKKEGRIPESFLRQNIVDKIKVLQCFIRFYDDLIDTTDIGKKTKEKFDKMQTVLKT